MSPKILEAGSLIFWFHSHDALHEDRASVHIGKSSHDDFNDAKVWLEPRIEIARLGHTLRAHELKRALKVIEQNLDYLMEQWYVHKRRAG